MYVLDSVKDTLFVYDLQTGELRAEHRLDKLNKSPRGLWSDGVTFWVSDGGAKRLFAYEFDDSGMTRNEDLEFTFRSLLRAGNGAPRGIWSDGHIIYVVDEQDQRAYSYNLPDAIITLLSSLTVSDVEFGEFYAGELEYRGTVDAGLVQTTVEASAAHEGALIVIAPDDADADPANGHQVAIAEGTVIEVAVSSADGSRTRRYRVLIEIVNRAPLAAEIAALELTAGGEPARLNLAEFFSDPDGDPLSYTVGAAANPEVATVALTDAVLTITPLSVGETSFNLSAGDSELESETRTVAVIVETANRAPLALEIPALELTAGGEPAQLNLAEWFSDPDGDPLSYTVGAASDAGVLTVALTGGVVTVTPIGAGTATVAVTASDGELSSETRSVTLTIEAAAPPPEVRIAARRTASGSVEFAVQLRAVDASWGERLLPRARFLPAEAELGGWLFSSPLELEPAQLSLRIAARPLAGGRVEFALQQRRGSGEWSDLMLPPARFLPAAAGPNWRTSSALVLDDGREP